MSGVLAAAEWSVFIGGLAASGFVVLITLCGGFIERLSYSLLTRMSLWAGAFVLAFELGKEVYG